MARRAPRQSAAKTYTNRGTYTVTLTDRGCFHRPQRVTMTSKTVTHVPEQPVTHVSGPYNQSTPVFYAIF